MTDEMRRALDAKHARDVRDREIHQTRAGHWHPGTVPCTRPCPMADSRTATVFQRVLAQAAGFTV